MTPEERAKHLMLKLFTRNDDGSWAGHFPNATDDLHHQQGIIASIIREAITQARASMREEAAQCVESFAPDYPTKTVAAAIRALEV